MWPLVYVVTCCGESGGKRWREEVEGRGGGKRWREEEEGRGGGKR